MRWYNPLSWFNKCENKKTAEQLQLEMEERGCRSMLREIVQKTKVRLQYEAGYRYADWDNSKQRNTYRCLTDLNQ